MKTILFHKWTRVVLRLILGGVFIYAGAVKFTGPQEFADSIATFQLVPYASVNVLALALPLFEIIVGLMLITGLQLRVGSLAAIATFCIFALALAQGLARGLTLDCGCFGSGKPSVVKNWISLGRDLLLLAGAVMLYLQVLPLSLSGQSKGQPEKKVRAS